MTPFKAEDFLNLVVIPGTRDKAESKAVTDKVQEWRESGWADPNGVLGWITAALQGEPANHLEIPNSSNYPEIPEGSRATKYCTSCNVLIGEQHDDGCPVVSGGTIARLREALEFYAEPANWLYTTHRGTWDGQSCADFETLKIGPGEIRQVAGRRARAALARPGSGEKGEK